MRVPFAQALTPGPKPFDANLSQFPITEQRKAAVDFSAPYFDVTQAIVTVKSSPAARARSQQDLKSLKLGAQVGTTSQTAALSLALVADLPTAFAVAGELRDGFIVGQLPADADDVEQFGIVLDKQSPLTRCVSSVVDRLRADGTLTRLERRWLADAGRAPILN